MNLSSTLQSSPGNNNNSETSWSHEWPDVSIYCATNLVVRWPRPPRLGGSAPSSCSPHYCLHVSTMMTSHFFSLLLTYYPIIHWAQRGSSLRPLLLYFLLFFFLIFIFFYSLVFGHLLKASRHAEEATRLPETQPAPACTAACSVPVTDVSTRLLQTEHFFLLLFQRWRHFPIIKLKHTGECAGVAPLINEAII